MHDSGRASPPPARPLSKIASSASFLVDPFYPSYQEARRLNDHRHDGDLAFLDRGVPVPPDMAERRRRYRALPLVLVRTGRYRADDASGPEGPDDVAGIAVLGLQRLQGLLGKRR